MKSFNTLYEDSKHAGYSELLATPRALGELDFKFFDLNKGLKVGDEIKTTKGRLKGSRIIELEKEFLKYIHKDGSMVHIESVDTKRNVWESIHVPYKNLYLFDEI